MNIDYEIKKTGRIKRWLGFGDYQLTVVYNDGYGAEVDVTYHDSYLDAEDYFFDVFGYDFNYRY